jgi:putative acetyltransferase
MKRPPESDLDRARPAIRADAPVLADIARSAITITAAPAYQPDQIASWSGSFSDEQLDEIIASTSVFVVEHRGDVAGFASLAVADNGRDVVDLLYVEPRFTGRGVARCALEAVEAAARRRGVSELWADASVPAVPVFEHLGYAVVERYEKTRGAITFPNTWLAKQLR